MNCKGTDDLREFLWADYKKGMWDGDHLSGILKYETSLAGMPSIGFREYRQIATAFMEKHLKHKLVNDSIQVDNMYDLQAGHSSLTTEVNYAIGDTDHRFVTREALHQFFLRSKSWFGLLLVLNKMKRDSGINCLTALADLVVQIEASVFPKMRYI